MNIPVEDITRCKLTQDAIVVECDKRGDCSVEVRDGCFIFPSCCTEKCRNLVVNHMKWYFNG